MTGVSPRPWAISPGWATGPSPTSTAEKESSRGIAGAATAPRCASPCWRIIPGNHTEESGLRAAATLLREPELPTAVLTFNDRCAVGLLDALSRAGVDVPGSVSIAGYDDSPLARLAHVNLTTVSQNTQQQAEQAVAAAIERLDEGRSVPREVVLSPRLVVRRTVGPPRPRPGP